MLHTAIVAKDYFPEAVYCRLVAYESGTIHLFLTFNEAEKDNDRLFIINNFNENNLGSKPILLRLTINTI